MVERKLRQAEERGEEPRLPKGTVPITCRPVTACPSCGVEALALSPLPGPPWELPDWASVAGQHTSVVFHGAIAAPLLAVSDAQ